MAGIKLVSCGLLNAQSARRQDRYADKPADIHDLILDHDLDLIVITETWFKDSHDQVAMGDMVPNGFKIQQTSRSIRRGGGVALIHKDSYPVTQLSPFSYTTFECSRCILKHPQSDLDMFLLYRPPESSLSTFFTEFGDMIEQHCSCAKKTIVLGDFNFHVDDASCPRAAHFKDLVTSLGLTQHVHMPTHKSSHTLDLILTQDSQPLEVSILGIDSSIPSDHFTVLFTLNLPKTKRQKITKTVRKWSSMDIAAFNDDIEQRCNWSSTESISDLVSSYNASLNTILDQHAPTITITITRRDTPWYTREVRHAKTECRRLERKWRRTRLTIDHEVYKRQRNRLHLLR